MLYEEKNHLRPMSRVYFQKDVAVNVHHNKVYSVKLSCNSKMLGHLSIDAVEAIHETNGSPKTSSHAL